MKTKASSQISVSPARAQKRSAVVVSLLVHAMILAVLATWYVRRESGTKEQSTAAPSRAAAPRKAPARPAPKREKLAPGEASPKVSPKQVSTTLDKTIAQMETKSDEEKLSLLDQHAQRLESISSEQSIGEIASHFQSWMNIESRAERPIEEPQPEAQQEQKAELAQAEAPPVKEARQAKPPFDFDTAQLHDVKRVAGDNGEWKYLSTLVDAAGQSFEVEMTEAEGAKAFATFERLKQFPLADKVYRQITMPLMDKVLSGSRTAPPATVKEAATIIAPVEIDDEDDRDPFSE